MEIFMLHVVTRILLFMNYKMDDFLISILVKKDLSEIYVHETVIN